MPEPRLGVNSSKPQRQSLIMVPPPVVSFVSANIFGISDVSYCRHHRRTAS
jgi:hypothetical protein